MRRARGGVSGAGSVQGGVEAQSSGLGPGARASIFNANLQVKRARGPVWARGRPRCDLTTHAADGTDILFSGVCAKRRRAVEEPDGRPDLLRRRLAADARACRAAAGGALGAPPARPSRRARERGRGARLVYMP